MKIAICTPMYRPDVNGLVTAIQERCIALKDLGHDVLLIAPTDNSQSSICALNRLKDLGVGIEIYMSKLDSKNGINRPIPSSFKKVSVCAIRTFKPQILFVDSPLIVFMFAGYIPKKLKACKVIGICHADVIEGLERGGFPLLAMVAKILGKIVYSRYHYTIVPSIYLQERIKHIKNSKVISFLGYKNINCLTEVEKDQKVFRIIYIGRIEREKNISFLFEVANEVVNKAVVDVEWIFVGGGGELQKWKQVAMDNIRFIGPKSPEEVRSWYKSADLFVTACEHESFGLTIVEAMSLGLPVLVPNSGMAPYHIPKSKEDAIYEKSNKEQLTQRILKVISDESFRNSIQGYRSELELDWNTATNNLLEGVVYE